MRPARPPLEVIVVIRRKEIMVGGTALQIETGRMAKQADGAVVVRYGDTMVLVTAVAAKTPREGVDFLPLTPGA